MGQLTTQKGNNMLKLKLYLCTPFLKVQLNPKYLPNNAPEKYLRGDIRFLDQVLS